MSPLLRRIVYVTLYELIAIAVVSAALAWIADRPALDSGIVAVASSAIAIGWAFVFNAMFERWEATRRVRGRTPARRVAHAIGFEGGLVVVLVPLIAWQLDVSLWEAFVYDFGLIVFFLVYTFVFTWVFDRVFGLPASARGEGPPATRTRTEEPSGSATRPPA
ncbi:PACE efflux transporter [Rhodoplanes serenus]|jgi:uncharacterized membrane protein|uniref:PACE efflux transporter n=1 Tax=Rhodoplanes serenus TaxID=200615 RepID=UPI000DABE462|nr:PACE efflux transporter [Rhodoplanes serenus]RAI32052.1 hypothetical protein CH340_16720 [Rhodoplanes serenus]